MKVLILTVILAAATTSAFAEGPIIIRGSGNITTTDSVSSATNTLPSSMTKSVSKSGTNSMPASLATNPVPAGYTAVTNGPTVVWKEISADVTNMPSITNPPSRHIEPSRY